jgi:hypothetical protein
MTMIECPCCHGERELAVTSQDGKRISFYVCTHCMGEGRVRNDAMKLNGSEKQKVGE